MNTNFGTDNPLNQLALVTPCNLISQGTDYTKRIGNQITIKSIQLKALVERYTRLGNVSCTDRCRTIRIMLVLDRSPTGALPVITDFLHSYVAGNEVSTLVSNLANRQRFISIWDKCYLFGPFSFEYYSSYNTQSIHTGDVQAHHFQKYKKVNVRVTYGATDNTIGALKAGAIYLVLITDLKTTYGDNATQILCQATVRIRFTDV